MTPFALLLLTPQTIAIQDLDLSLMRNGWGKPRINASVTGQPMKIAGETFTSGIGTHSTAILKLALDGKAEKFSAKVGVNESGGGQIGFEIYIDRRLVWTSGTMRKADAAKAVDIPLSGARLFSLVVTDGGNGSSGDHADIADASFTFSGSAPTPMVPMLEYKLHPKKTRQRIDNFAASDSWTVEPLIRWPERSRNKVADLLFDPVKGIALSGWRFNLGGGINHETINNPLRTVDTFERGEGVYDWNAVPGQRWMLQAAKERGVERFIAYSITPTRRMTLNGFTTGDDGKGSTNLKQGMEGQFARYLVDVVDHFQKNGIPFSHLSPINEPDFEWNQGSQEGNRASNADIVRITQAIHNESTRRGVDLRILTPEASSPFVGYGRNDGMTRKYGSQYGDYAAMFSSEEAWRNAVKPVFGYHSYWSDRLESIVEMRKRLREALNKVPDTEVWQTEYCQLSGPRGEGGWGRDLGMTLALSVARLIHFDLTIVQASAWQWWLGVSNGDYKDGLVYVDDLDKKDGDVFASKTLWALGNWSKFVRPGMVRIEVEGPQPAVDGVLTSAYTETRTGKVVVVLVNTTINSEGVSLELPGAYRVTPHITSDRPGHDLKALRPIDLKKPYTVPSRSVVTLVCEPRP